MHAATGIKLTSEGGWELCGSMAWHGMVMFWVRQFATWKFVSGLNGKTT
jgi:hypothetical protein